MAPRLEDLPVHDKAVAFCRAVIEILETSEVRRFRRLHEQISDAADSVLANMYEGFAQGTDASFAHYLTISKGSVGEILGRMRVAQVRRLVSAEQVARIDESGHELQRMLAGFIRYLRHCNWKDRGRHDSGLG